MGRKPILDDQREAIIVDVLIRKDRANEGARVGEAVDILEKMCPEYSRKQLDLAFRRTVRPQYSERMTNPVAVQATTTKQNAGSAVALAQGKILARIDCVGWCGGSFLFN